MRVDERNCRLCNSDMVEDELHFLFECVKYFGERATFYRHCTNKNQHFENLSNTDKLKIIMNEEWKEAARYICNIWQKRRDHEYV